ncbi:MAG: rod shape-determining protein MreD [Clostridia bacterium]|nr:rod shape-determining protein MreD [Clostridia bacterium]
MTKKIFLYSLGFLLLFFIEAVFRPISVFGVSPMYVLCGVSAMGILEKEKFGAIFGLIFGLLCDFTGGSLFGSQALVFMITGFIAGTLSEITLSKSFFSTLVITASSIIVFGGLKSLFYIVLNEEEPLSVLLYIMLPKFLLTLPFSVLIYFMLKFLQKISAPNRERKKRKKW